jgi:uncharacterized membrane protein
MTDANTVAIPSTTPAVPLPNWSDPTSIASWLMSIATFVIAILTMTGTVLPASTSTSVTAWSGIAGIVIAAGFAVANFVRVTVLHKAAITSGHAVGIKPTRVIVVP